MQIKAPCATDGQTVKTKPHTHTHTKCRFHHLFEFRFFYARLPPCFLPFFPSPPSPPPNAESREFIHLLRILFDMCLFGIPIFLYG